MLKKKYRVDQVEQLRAEVELLKQSIEQLHVLNELARQIGAAENLEELNHTLVRQALKMINAEQGVVTLIEMEKKNALQTLFRTRLQKADNQVFRPDPLILGWMHQHRKPLRISTSEDQVGDQKFRWHPSIRSVLCVPLIVQNRLIGLLSLFNKKEAEEFSQEDEKTLFIIAMQSSQIIENQRLIDDRNRVKLIFGQHVSPSMVDEILEAGTEILSRRMPMCVMFMDIRGFSTFAEKRQPEEVVAYLNGLFDFLIDCVLEHNGIIHRLMGDSFVALFGAPISSGNDQQNAVDAGLEMLKRLEAKCAAGLLPPTRIGIGIHAGEVVAGTVGSANRKEYQINGDVVNLAARIEQLNKSFDAQMLISETVWQAIDQSRYRAESLGQVKVKGRNEPVQVYKLA